MVLMFEQWIGKNAVVTGASSGLGAKIAEELVKRGVNVVGIARRVDRIETLSRSLQRERGKLYAVKANLMQENEVLEAFKWIEHNVGPISILINNAGIIQSSTIMDGDISKWKKIFDTNIMAVCICTREAIRSMRKNNIDGQIIHISSIFGHIPSPIPKMNVYSASKSAVNALRNSIKFELNDVGSKIKVTTICPGLMDTEIAQNNEYEMTDKEIEAVMALPKLKAEDTTDAVIYVLSTPPSVQIHDLVIKAVNEPFI